MGLYQFLLGFTRFYWVLLGSTGFFQLLKGLHHVSLGSYWATLCFIAFGSLFFVGNIFRFFSGVNLVYWIYSRFELIVYAFVRLCLRNKATVFLFVADLVLLVFFVKTRSV